MKTREIWHLMSLFKDREICYINELTSFYDVKKKVHINSGKILDYLELNNREELLLLRAAWTIKTYDGLVYWKDKEWYLNILDKNSILQPNNKTPLLAPWIEKLFNSVCWWKQENIEWLEKAILYKYLNITDYNIPAVIFYWAGWTWKGTMMKLLSKIFWWENVVANLWQKDILWDFSWFNWNKLIVEFAEISSNNMNKDTQINNRLKWLIMAEKINVNKKFLQPY